MYISFGFDLCGMKPQDIHLFNETKQNQFFTEINYFYIILLIRPINIIDKKYNITKNFQCMHMHVTINK